MHEVIGYEAGRASKNVIFWIDVSSFEEWVVFHTERIQIYSNDLRIELLIRHLMSPFSSVSCKVVFSFKVLVF